MSIWDDIISGTGDIWDNLNDGEGFEIDNIIDLLGAYGGYQGWFNSDQQKAGYQGKIPDYTAVREQVPIQWNAAHEENQRRPGEYGQRYFTDTTYAQTPEDQLKRDNHPSLEQARDAAALQIQALSSKNKPSAPGSYESFAGGGIVDAMAALKGEMGVPQMNMEAPPPQGIPPGMRPGAPPRRNLQQRPAIDPQYLGSQGELLVPPSQLPGHAQRRAAHNEGIAGITGSPQASYKRGPTDGMADQMPAMIEGQQPAAFSHGEMVIPADVVGHLGNGNSEAGAEQLYSMMDRIRQARTGSKQQGNRINPNSFLPT